jgi:hypothetical protein
VRSSTQFSASTLVLSRPPLRKQTHTKCVISGLLCKLSWHDDNKIMIYQAADELVPRLLLQWLCDTEIQSAAEHNSYIAQARINMATGEIRMDSICYLL